MTYKLAAFLLVPWAAVTAGDGPTAILQSCAYTASLSPAPPRSSVFFEIRDAAGNVARDESYLFTPSDHIVVRAAVAGAAGYFYVFQDPADPDSLVYQDPVTKGRHTKGGLAIDSPAMRFNRTTDFTLLMAVTPEPLPGVGAMTLAEARRYLELRRACWGSVMQERKIRFRP